MDEKVEILSGILHIYITERKKHREEITTVRRTLVVSQLNIHSIHCIYIFIYFRMDFNYLAQGSLMSYCKIFELREKRMLLR